jgi:peptide/nickel transport system substrate-binding protein
MKEARKKNNGISRRDFLKKTGAGAGALALGGIFSPRRASAKLVGNVPASKFIYSWEESLMNIDPQVAAHVPPYSYRLNMYGELYRYQGNPPKLEPWIAESYEVSPDAQKWTFRLKKGLKFHDGNEITAEDVRFSAERVLEMGKAAAANFKPVMKKDAVKVIDKYTCQFNLDKPVGYFVTLIPLLSIVNSKLVKQNEKSGDYGAAWLANNEAGSGAYKLKTWDPAKGFVAEQWPGWPQGWSGKHFKEIEVNTIVEMSSRVAALMKGDIHATDPYLPPDQIERLNKNPNTKVITTETMRTFFIRLNCIRPPTSNVHFRRALNYAFPYNEYIEKALANNGVRSKGGPIPNILWGWPKDLKMYDTDMEKAKQELAMAKKELKPEEFNRPITIKALKGATATRIAALYLQSRADELGLKMNVQEETFPVVAAAACDPKTTPDIWMHWMSAYYLDPDNWIGKTYSKLYFGSQYGSVFYTDEKVEALLEKGRTSTDRESRQKAYEEACRLIVADAPDIWVANTTANGAFTSDVQGWRFCDSGMGQEFYWMWRE